jgi:hypothetical protein
MDGRQKHYRLILRVFSLCELSASVFLYHNTSFSVSVVEHADWLVRLSIKFTKQAKACSTSAIFVISEKLVSPSVYPLFLMLSFSEGIIADGFLLPNNSR